MDMESGLGTDEIVGSCNYNDAAIIAKGKRTKRMRPLSPCAVAATVMTCSSSSASGDQVSGGGDCGSFSSTTTTATFEGANQEEEDMANCLILLAQGGRDAHHKHQAKNHYCGGDGRGDENNKRTERGSSSSSNTSRRFTEMPIAPGSKIGFYIYECKTCNRTFPSFQALGGHRASHKRPKAMAEEKKPPPPPPLPPPPPSTLITTCDFEEAGQFHIKSGNPPISFQLGCSNGSTFHGNKSKVHECSICGSEFGSGQALGGHMRRHRATTNTSSQAVETTNACETGGTTATAAVDVKTRKVLQLDLNLPAPPEDDHRDSKFYGSRKISGGICFSGFGGLPLLGQGGKLDEGRGRKLLSDQ